MAGEPAQIHAATTALDEVRAVIRSTISNIEVAFNSIEKLQSRTRLTLALSLLEKGPQTPAKFAKVTADLTRTLASFNVDERHYWISTFYTLLINASLRREKAIYFTPPAIVQHLIRKSELAGIDFKKARVIDPAAGGAAFISSIAGRMVVLIGVGSRRRSASQAIDLPSDGGVKLECLFTISAHDGKLKHFCVHTRLVSTALAVEDVDRTRFDLGSVSLQLRHSPLPPPKAMALALAPQVIRAAKGKKPTPQLSSRLKALQLIRRRLVASAFVKSLIRSRSRNNSTPRSRFQRD